jgi:hypothetical protein
MHQLTTLIAALTTALTIAYRRRHDRSTVEAARESAARALNAIWTLIDED